MTGATATLTFVFIVCLKVESVNSDILFSRDKTFELNTIEIWDIVLSFH